MMSEGESKAARVEQVAPDTQIIRASSMGEAERELRRAQGATVVVLLPAGADDSRKAIHARVWTKEGRRLIVAVGVDDWRAALGLASAGADAVEPPIDPKPKAKRRRAPKAEAAPEAPETEPEPDIEGQEAALEAAGGGE